VAGVKESTYYQHSKSVSLASRLSAYRAILAKASYRYWADEAYLNILSGNALRRMLPAGVKGQVETVRLFGLSSNLIAFGDSQEAVG